MDRWRIAQGTDGRGEATPRRCTPHAIEDRAIGALLGLAIGGAKPREAGESLTDIARTYGVAHATTCNPRFSGHSAGPHQA